MGGRPAKPAAVIAAEGKSHRTKAEMEKRRKEEAAFASGTPLKEKPETRQNVVAHKEFLRVTKLLTEIGKCDALYENIINRYCMIYAETRDFEEKRERFYKDLWEMEEHFSEGKFGEDVSAYYSLKCKMQQNILALDKQIQVKRKMLMDIEKENVMTISSVLRNIPKTEEKEENPLLIALKGGSA